jgi:hypothetical protein
MSLSRILAIAALALSTAVTSAAANCDGIPHRHLRDGEWLFRVGNSWYSVEKLADWVRPSRSRNVNFVYVVRDNRDATPRRGLLVIKTGTRFPESAPTSDTGHVALRRDAFPRASDCERDERQARSTVTAKSYDDYHDWGYQASAGDRKAIEQFHVKYGSKTSCHFSNDARPDAFFAGKLASNRSQFSFDPNVVRQGQHSQFLSWFGIRAAYAGQPIADRKVEIKKYAASKDGLACVDFNIQVSHGSFIRINDLERRTLFRAEEGNWEWPNE